MIDALVAAIVASCTDDGFVPLAPVRMTSLGAATFAAQADGSLKVEGTSAETDTFVFEFEALPKGVTAFKIEALPDPTLAASGPGRSSNGNFVLTELRASVGPKGSKRPKPMALQRATADFSQNGLPAPAAIDGNPATGWGIDPKQGVAHHLVVETRSDLDVGTGVLTLELEMSNGSQNTIGRLRISATTKARPVRADLPPDAASWGETQERINRAIDAGCEWLLTQQILDGSWDVDAATYRNGGTALATYALAKSGVPGKSTGGHPAMARAVEYMRCVLPRETYTLGCQLLALHSLDDASHDPWIRQLGEQLAQFQQNGGGFSYGHGTGIDLSNSQYGALGLRVAAQHGFKVAPDAWEKLAGFVLAQSEESGGGGGYSPVGFKYAAGSTSTGSMTAAGAGVLAICDEQLKGRTKLGSLIATARRGAEWLGENFMVESNPRSSGEWQYYYLYGVERVGALLKLEELGGHRWYREGAKWLVDHQDADGKWSVNGNGPLCNTAWALLFLTRATSVASGQSAPRAAKLYGGDDPKKALSLRASGDTPLTFWISSFGEAELDQYEWPKEQGRGPRVKKVEWFVVGLPGRDDEVRVAQVEKDGVQPCGRERFGGQYSFPLPGKYSLFARAHLIAPPQLENGPGGEVTIESPMLDVTVSETSDPELLRYAGDAARNLLFQQKPRVTASSTLEGYDAKNVCDGLLVRAWSGSDQDPKPKITIELEKPARANLLQLTTAILSPDRPARIRKVNVTINGKGPPLELVIDTTPHRKSKLRLPQVVVVRRIDLDVTEVEMSGPMASSDSPQKGVAIAEVELQLEGGGKK